MTYSQAYKVALSKSETFRKHVSEVVRHSQNGTRSACMAFSVGDEAFYLGFDGCEMHTGKYNPNRAAHLITRGNTLVIE